MHTSTEVAVKAAQSRRRSTPSGYEQDLYDQALDELLRQPDRDGDPERLLANAIANARKRFRRRQEIAPVVSYGGPVGLVDLFFPGEPDHGPGVIDALEWLGSAPLTRSEQTALMLEAHGFDAPFVAAGTSLTVNAARQRLTRARSSARTARVRHAW
jgi:hypothetical protein